MARGGGRRGRGARGCDEGGQDRGGGGMARADALDVCRDPTCCFTGQAHKSEKSNVLLIYIRFS